MNTTLKTIKEACFIYGCKREVSKEILGLEKELREMMSKEIPKLQHLTVVYIKDILGT